MWAEPLLWTAYTVQNNYLSNGEKVRVFSRDKPEIFYCSSEARTTIVRGFIEWKNTFSPFNVILFLILH